MVWPERWDFPRSERELRDKKGAASCGVSIAVLQESCVQGGARKISPGVWGAGRHQSPQSRPRGPRQRLSVSCLRCTSAFLGRPGLVLRWKNLKFSLCPRRTNPGQEGTEGPWVLLFLAKVFIAWKGLHCPSVGQDGRVTEAPWVLRALEAAGVRSLGAVLGRQVPSPLLGQLRCFTPSLALSAITTSSQGPPRPAHLSQWCWWPPVHAAVPCRAVLSPQPMTPFPLSLSSPPLAAGTWISRQGRAARPCTTAV